MNLQCRHTIDRRSMVVNCPSPSPSNRLTTRNIDDLLNTNFDDIGRMWMIVIIQDIQKVMHKYLMYLRNTVKDLMMACTRVMSPTMHNKLLCNAFQNCGGMHLLTNNCKSNNPKTMVPTSSSPLPTAENRAYVVDKRPEKVILTHGVTEAKSTQMNSLKAALVSDIVI